MYKPRKLKNWLYSSLPSDQYYLIGLLLLGFMSGLIFKLAVSILPFHLNDLAVKASHIPGFNGKVLVISSLATLPYSLKLVLSPFVNQYFIPYFCARLGQRRGWIMVGQLSLLCVVGCLLLHNQWHNLIFPLGNLYITAIILCAICFFATVADLVVETYRMERCTTKEALALAVSCSGLGFRLGMLVGGSGALYLASIYGWNKVYDCIFLLLLIGPMIVLCIKEPEGTNKTTNALSVILKRYFSTLQAGTTLLRANQPNFLLALVFIGLYKAPDVIPMTCKLVLLPHLSFTKQEIGLFSEAYGLVIMIIGGMLGGIIAIKLSLFQSVLIGGALQLLSPFMFIILSSVGYHMPLFIATMTIQNFCSGVSTTVLTTYLTTLCQGTLKGVQYAILVSLASLARVIFSAAAGFYMKIPFLPGIITMKWPFLFLLTLLLGILAILIFLKIYRVGSPSTTRS